MNTPHPYQPKRAPAISWSVAIGIALGGAAMLAFAIYTSRPKTVEALKDNVLEQMLAEAANSEKELDAFRKSVDKPAAELRDLENANKNTADSIAKRTALIRTVDANNEKMVSEIRAQIKKLEGQTEDELKKAVAFDDKNSEKLKKERDFREALTDMQNAVVTIQAPKGVVGSGILFSGFKTPMVVTTMQNAPAEGELIVNVRYIPKGFTNILSATAKGKLVYADKETGLAFVSIETDGSIPLTTFSRDSIRGAAATEEIHLITSYASPDGIFDVIMFEGTVSSLEEMSGERKLMRVAVVANEGSSGAPLVGMDKKLVGIFFKSVEGAEKAALAISGPDLTKAIERMPKK